MDAPSIPAFSSVRWKNLCEFEALEIIPAGGVPRVSQILDKRLYSDAPGNRGRPRKSSAATHPRLHMSIGMPYDAPRTTSGDR